MMEPKAFEKKVQEILDEIGEQRFRYDEREFWMYIHTYNYVKERAYERQLLNTLIALPMVRSLHDGVHRKGTAQKDGVAYRLPYVTHCLRVCQMLLDLNLPLSTEEEDIVMAAALSHDVLEDVPFPNGGTEMMSIYHLDRRVYDVVDLLTKRKSFTEEQHLNYFRKIQSNPFSLLIKLSDRGSNVEDPYNMSMWKNHEYIDETRDHILPMCDYGMEEYHYLYGPLLVLKDKITTLIDGTENLVRRYEEKEDELNTRLEALKRENQRLRDLIKELEV